MAFIDKKDVPDIYTASKDEAKIWKEDYPAYERLANNELMDELDPNLPEVNDGSLAASLFKLPKRVVNRTLSGTVKTLNRDEAWIGELANLQWQNEIIPKANMQAPFIRKWKDAVRKSAIYGGVPLITLFIDRNDERTTDFIVAQPQDVTIEVGKVSDMDSDIMFWDVYYTDLQVENMIEEAKEREGAKNVLARKDEWDVPTLEMIFKSKSKESRDSIDSNKQNNDKGVHPEGFHFYIAYQRGVNAPFFMIHEKTGKCVHEWTNDDPTGDMPIHYLYCYQDFINPYGIGIVKLAGGTQNVLDYMRQADVLATQIGLRPPKQIQGDPDEVDFESLVYAQDADWFVGNAKVERMDLADGIYAQLPNRIQMYQGSLNKIIPTGDTSVSAAAGDPTQSKTPAGVKFQAANLSIDDEDYKDNLYATYAAVAASMINIKFANMEGTDLMKLSDDERQVLINAGLNFPQNEEGEMSNQLELVWDKARAKFQFVVDPEQDKAKDDETKLKGLTTVYGMIKEDPTLPEGLKANGNKINKGELVSEIIRLTTDNDKIVTDITPDEEEADGIDPETGQPTTTTPPDPQSAIADQKMRHAEEKHQLDIQAKEQDMARKQQSFDEKQAAQGVQGATPQPATLPTPQEMQANIDAVMQQYGVDEETALIALAAEHDGADPAEIASYLQQHADNQAQMQEA